MFALHAVHGTQQPGAVQNRSCLAGIRPGADIRNIHCCSSPNPPLSQIILHLMYERIRTAMLNLRYFFEGMRSDTSVNALRDIPFAEECAGANRHLLPRASPGAECNDHCRHDDKRRRSNGKPCACPTHTRTTCSTHMRIACSTRMRIACSTRSSGRTIDSVTTFSAIWARSSRSSALPDCPLAQETASRPLLP